MKRSSDDDLALIFLKAFAIAFLVCISSAVSLLSMASKIGNINKE